MVVIPVFQTLSTKIPNEDSIDRPLCVLLDQTLQVAKVWGPYLSY